MRKTIHRAIFVWNFDKEEKWLNEMAAKGWCLVSVGFCKYEFEECEPGAYKICMQLLNQDITQPESQQYIAFLESTGAEQVGAFQRWVYLRKKAADGEFELFSDYPSRIRHLSRIIHLITTVIGCNWLIGICNVLLATFNGSPLNYIGIINLVIGIGGLIGLSRLFQKRKLLEQDGQVFE